MKDKFSECWDEAPPGARIYVAYFLDEAIYRHFPREPGSRYWRLVARKRSYDGTIDGGRDERKVDN